MMYDAFTERQCWLEGDFLIEVRNTQIVMVVSQLCACMKQRKVNYLDHKLPSLFHWAALMLFLCLLLVHCITFYFNRHLVSNEKEISLQGWVEITGFQHSPDGLATQHKGYVFQSVRLQVMAQFLTQKFIKKTNSVCLQKTAYSRSGIG